MSTLIQRMQTRYLHNHDFLAALGRESTCALSDFLGNQQVMSAFSGAGFIPVICPGM